MEKVKIISNPYKRKNIFMTFDEDNDKWIEIDINNNPNSKLLNNDLSEGFFSFKINKILDNIIMEYSSGEQPIDIYFEGTDDDYQELSDICLREAYADKINLIDHLRTLKNAEEVLPEVVRTFNDLKPIILEDNQNNQEIIKNLNKFLDVSNDIIPICVMGNYSSGKSTFINALIGQELLPTGDEPVTSKIFKIIQIKEETSSQILFNNSQDILSIMFKEETWLLPEKLDEDIAAGLNMILEKVEDKNETSLINQCLSYLNTLEIKYTSDLITIYTHFTGDLWTNQNARYVILDTPGNNSVTNIDHAKVLNLALKGLSNGLPIFVSEYDQIDSVDSKKLFDKMKSMKEIDDRFTMIVVNKADENDLSDDGYFTESKENDILALAVPKSLYAQGIFFVSSIMGLGYKTNGQFIDHHSGRIFRKNKTIFDDKTDIDYLQLYRFNIMPKQLKEAALQKAQQNTNLLYVNSGLFSVEDAISSFANKYASYNKCQQSTLYLENIIDVISQIIADEKVRREEIKKELKEGLEKDKQQLVMDLYFSKEAKLTEFIDDYEGCLADYAKKGTPSFSLKEVEKYKESLTSEQKALLNYEVTDKKMNESVESLKKNLSQNIGKVLNKPSIQSVVETGKTLASDTSETIGSYKELHGMKNVVYRNAMKILLAKVNDEHTKQIITAKNQIDNESRTYWNGKADELRQSLIDIVTDSTALSDNKKNELYDIILSYQKIEFMPISDYSIEKEDFNYHIKIFDIILFETDRLDIHKLVNKSNQAFNEETRLIIDMISNSHQKSFINWLESLFSMIESNVVNYSPKLSRLQEHIDEESAHIQQLENHQGVIEEGITYITRLIDWQ